MPFIPYHFQLFLVTVNDESIDLKLPPNLSFMIPETSVCVMNHEIDDDVNTIDFCTYIEIEDSELNFTKIYRDHLGSAFKEVEQSLKILSFAYDLNLTHCFDGASRGESLTDKIPEQNIELFKNEINVIEIMKFKDTLSQLRHENYNLYRLGLASIKYYSRYLVLWDNELNEEAFLSLFKSMEIISNHIYKEYCKNNFTNQIESIVPDLLKEIFKEDFQKNGQDQVIHKSIINDLN